MTCFLHFPLCMLINGLAKSEKRPSQKGEEQVFSIVCERRDQHAEKPSLKAWKRRRKICVSTPNSRCLPGKWGHKEWEYNQFIKSLKYDLPSCSLFILDIILCSAFAKWGKCSAQKCMFDLNRFFPLIMRFLCLVKRGDAKEVRLEWCSAFWKIGLCILDKMILIAFHSLPSVLNMKVAPALISLNFI